MRYIFLAGIVISVVGCDISNNSPSGRFALFEASNGTVYLLDTSSGDSEVFYSPSGIPKLTVNGHYEGEGEGTFVYLGNGTLRELSSDEEVDYFMEKYGE